MSKSNDCAPGAPGISPKWTSSAKTGVGTALSQESLVWFTLSHGIFNEIYYPQIDQPCIRDMGLIVTDGKDFFSEEKRNATSKIHWLADGVPAFKLINTCHENRYQIEKEIVTDPHRPCVLQKVRFSVKKGTLADYHLYALLAPHLAHQGEGNTAWIGEFNGEPLLFAQRNDCCLALASSAGWIKRSAGYVGVSDGWQDLRAHKKMQWEYARAENGNVALTAEIDLTKSEGEFVLALGFGKNPNEAAENAIASLQHGFESCKKEYISKWEEWIQTHPFLKKNSLSPGDLAPISAAILRTHDSKINPGGLIASLSIPWGESHGDKDVGGYHLIWPRDLVQAAGGFLAIGAHADACRILKFLQATQQPDGHWPQNMWLDGTAQLKGIQMDETALPILLLDLAIREGALSQADAEMYWPMVLKAVTYLIHNGPVSPEDRWEEDPGYTPFTLGAEIAALLAAADLADLHRESAIGEYLRQTADVWNTSIERWIYVFGTDWCQKYHVDGYYVRIAPMTGEGITHSQNEMTIKNVTSGKDKRLARHLVSPDALALVRFGLRAPLDPRIVNTTKIIDALLKIETPSGVTWHRYNGDGYGEHEDGSPFDGVGIGRGWPLLTGERAHYELAANRQDLAKQLKIAMEGFQGEGGLLPEQVWDRKDIPEKGLYCGNPSGSAMPLVWAHAEYLKLCRSLQDGKVFDMPPQTLERYLKKKTVAPRVIWRFNHKMHSMPPGKNLRIETLAKARIRWSCDEWKTTQEISTQDVGLGMYTADLQTHHLPSGGEVKFTFFWEDAKRWEGKDFVIRVMQD